MEYTKNSAKDWAQETFHGVCNVILPSYTADLKGLNEKGIRHDVRRNIELGFWGALLVSEVGTTMEEMRQFMQIAVDEANGRHRFLLHGMFDTTEDIVRMANEASEIGVDGMLLGHPNSFYPKDNNQLYEYIEHVVNRTEIAVVLFAASHWNFQRLHPSGYPTDVLVRAADLPNVVALKYEVGRPGFAGDYEFWKMIKGKRIIFSDPFEPHSPVTVELFGQQWMGTSNFEYCGGAIPKEFALLREGRYEEAMKLYWQIHPARTARMTEQAAIAGANFIHRYLWKYQAWLHGYNGGPLRQPVMKLNDGQMRRLRDSLVRAGLEPTSEEPSEFFVGRNPA